MTRVTQIFDRHSEDVDCRAMSEDDFWAAVKQVVQDPKAMAELEVAPVPSGFVIDCKGRILMDGVHVGWVRREIAVDEMRGFLNAIGVDMMPDKHEMAQMVEAEAA